MLEISYKVLRDLSFVRIDFFENSGELYIAELSFTAWVGLWSYESESLNYEMRK